MLFNETFNIENSCVNKIFTSKAGINPVKNPTNFQKIISLLTFFSQESVQQVLNVQFL